MTPVMIISVLLAAVVLAPLVAVVVGGAKVKRTVRGISRGKNWKKAYVRVAAGQEIDFMVTD